MDTEERLKCVKCIKPGGWYGFVHGSLNVSNCAIKTQLPLINAVELIVFPALKDLECWLRHCTVLLFLNAIFCLKTQCCVDQLLSSVYFSITVETANACGMRSQAVYKYHQIRFLNVNSIDEWKLFGQFYVEVLNFQ